MRGADGTGVLGAAELRSAWTAEGDCPYADRVAQSKTRIVPANHCGLMAIRLGRQSGAVPPWLLHMLGLLLSLTLT